MSNENNDEMALLIGKTILKFVNPLVISIDGHIRQGKIKGQILVGYVGSLTEYAKESIKRNNPKWKLDITKEIEKVEK